MEEKNQRNGTKAGLEPEFFLQWGNRKRLRCVRVKDPQMSQRSNGAAGGIKRRVSSRFDRCLVEKDTSVLQPNRPTRNSEGGAPQRSGVTEARKSSSPEKEDRYYTTRGSVGAGLDEIGKVSMDSNNNKEEKVHVWPKLYIALTNKEKEEDFLLMKGCKPPHRPKKRAKIIQRSLLLVSPGAWLTDMCQERYEVKEKKSTKKRPTGLKAMGGIMESDSE
ncbi:hypothetical protein ACFE04_023366 [Oxalis oulophora]